MRVSANISPNWQQATTLDELVDGPVVFRSGRRQLAEVHEVLFVANARQMACFVGRNQKYQDTSIDAGAWQVEDSGAFFETVHGVLLDHGMRDPIFSSHLVKTSLAIEKELDEASESTRAWLLSGLNRFLNSPLKQKHVRRLARQAIDLVGRDY